jgi:hypothetical protein
MGAAADPTSRQLMGSGLVIVDQTGRPVIDLGVDDSGAGRMHLRGPSGVAEVVLSGGSAGGRLDLYAADGGRLAKLAASPSGDGMLLLSDTGGGPLMRIGRWIPEASPSVWTPPLTDPSTP